MNSYSISTITEDRIRIIRVLLYQDLARFSSIAQEIR